MEISINCQGEIIFADHAALVGMDIGLDALKHEYDGSSLHNIFSRDFLVKDPCPICRLALSFVLHTRYHL